MCSEEEERAYYLQTVASRKQLAKSRKGKKRNIRGQDKVWGRGGGGERGEMGEMAMDQ